MFNEKLGYCGAIPLFADIEYNRSQKGLYEDFKAKFEEIYGSLIAMYAEDGIDDAFEDYGQKLVIESDE